VTVHSGPKASPDGLVLSFDLANKKSFANSVINSLSWNLGSGGATYYSQNGNTNENERVLGTDPFGKSSIVWETRPSGDGNADGGWNSDYFGIDNTKLYRFSVWVKRTSTTSGGTFYLGLYGNASGIRRTDNNAYEGNPYWDCRGTGGFEKDIWYLVVGHCYPYNTSYTGQHPESGIYTVSGGSTKVLSINACNIGADVKWAGANVTQGIHRCYHYYCSDATTRLQLFDPRVDAIDGTEPSVSSLLSGFTASRVRNYNNDSVIGTFANTPTYSSANGGSLVFDGVDDYINIPFNASAMDFSTAQTICMWLRPATGSNTSRRNPYNQAYGGSGTLTYETSGDINYYFGTNGGNGSPYVGKSSGFTVAANETAFISVTRNQSTNVCNWYKNGQLITTSDAGGYAATANGTSPITIGSGYAGKFLGNIFDCKVYNRALTASEIQQNFNANRSRFGI